MIRVYNLTAGKSDSSTPLRSLDESQRVIVQELQTFLMQRFEAPVSIAVHKDQGAAVIGAFKEAKCALVHYLALSYGLKQVKLFRVPDAEEAFDGDLQSVSRLLTELIALGLGNIRVAATNRSERITLVDFYGVRPPIDIGELTDASASLQEAHDGVKATRTVPSVATR